MLTIKLNYQVFLRQSAAVQQDMLREQPEMLREVGVDLLSLCQRNYIDKARGGGGADGKPWRPLQAATILARLRKRNFISGSRKGQATVLKSNKGTTTLLQSLRKQGAIEIIHAAPKGKGGGKGGKRRVSRNAVRKGDTIRIINGRQAVTSINAGRKSKNKQRVSSIGAFEIGVDTGLQRASASPGFIGPDGKGGNLLLMSQASVTVGYNRTYSDHFDRLRPLIPNPLPEAWLKRIGRRVQRWAEGIVHRHLRDEGGK